MFDRVCSVVSVTLSKLESGGVKLPSEQDKQDNAVGCTHVIVPTRIGKKLLCVLVIGLMLSRIHSFMLSGVKPAGTVLSVTLSQHQSVISVTLSILSRPHLMGGTFFKQDIVSETARRGHDAAQSRPFPFSFSAKNFQTSQLLPSREGREKERVRQRCSSQQFFNNTNWSTAPTTTKCLPNSSAEPRPQKHTCMRLLSHQPE